MLPILVVALWLGTRPYAGIVGDARFYNVQFLRALNPAAYAGDLYFAFGSQDDYSIFTAVCAPVIRLLGLNAGNIVLNLAFQATWLTGLWALVTALLPGRRARLLAVAAVLVLPGSVNFIRYGEPLVTPRLLAEALTLWALGAMLRRRWFAAIAILLLAASVHPLMAIPGFGVLFLQAAQRNRLWYAAPPVAACAAALLLPDLPPFAEFATAYDPAWFAIVNVRDGFCLIGNWNLADWLPICTTLILSLTGICFATARERSLLIMALVTAVAGLAASFVGADLLHITLVTAAQLWRAAWLLAVLANLCLASSLTRLWTRRGLSRSSPATALLASAGLLALARFCSATEMVAAPLALVGLVAAAWSAWRRRPLGGAARSALTAAILLAAATALFAVQASLRVLAVTPRGVGSAMTSLALVGLCLAAFGVVVFWPAAFAGCWKRRIAGSAIALALLAASIAQWDQRPVWRTMVETAKPPPSLLAQVPPGSTVYWEGDVTVPWLLLRQASYFSCEQGTGSLFKRGTAMAFEQRSASFGRLGTIDFWHDPHCPVLRNRFVVPITHADLSSLCQRERSLDKIVLTRPVEDDLGIVWRSTVGFTYTMDVEGERRLDEQQDFHIYDCAVLRRG